jgi:hypothetical protein
MWARKHSYICISTNNHNVHATKNGCIKTDAEFWSLVSSDLRIELSCIQFHSWISLDLSNKQIVGRSYVVDRFGWFRFNVGLGERDCYGRMKPTVCSRTL